MQTKSVFNVAPSSTEGHFIQAVTHPKTREHVNVVLIDEVEELSLVKVPKGTKTLMASKNHTNLPIEQSGVACIQHVFHPDPAKDLERYRRAID
jgi:hypothetical protein